MKLAAVSDCILMMSVSSKNILFPDKSSMVEPSGIGTFLTRKASLFVPPPNALLLLPVSLEIVTVILIVFVRILQT